MSRRQLQHYQTPVSRGNASIQYDYYPDQREGRGNGRQEERSYSYKTHSSYSSFNQKPSIKKRDPCKILCLSCVFYLFCEGFEDFLISSKFKTSERA